MLIPLTFAITLVIYYVTLQIPHQNTISYEEVYKDKLDIPTATPTLSKTIGSQTYTLVLGDTGLNMNLNDKPVYKNNIETISSSNIIDFWPINGGKVLLLAINTHNVIKGKTQLVRINIPTLNPSETYSISTITSLEHVLYGGFRILDYNQTTDTLLVIDIGADANAIYGSIGKISQGTYSNVTDIAGGSFQKNTPRYLGYFNSRLIMARINETNNYYESVYYFDPNSLTEKIIIGKNQMPENIYSIDFVESADNPTIKLKEEKTSKDYIFNLKKQVFEN